MPPRGGIPVVVSKPPISLMFQVMPPRGGILKVYKALPVRKVSSHAPARGHRCMATPLCIALEFQVMPPRGGISFPVQSVRSHP